jgi:uroporphyrinogen-III decarboxylase
MTDKQWETLRAVISGETLDSIPVGFIIDSPWLPGWAGIDLIEYYSSEDKWLEVNLKAVREFPEVLFLPGFWSEYGMCTEPSAFGAKCTWSAHELPFADRIIKEIGDIANLKKPNPATDGLLPFMLHRLKSCRPSIEEAGHKIRFAVARGPLNIASFLMGSTEFLLASQTDRDEIIHLLDVITDFTVDWLRLQAETISSIDGILILDDIVGFIGDDDFKELAMPCLKRGFQSFDASVKCFHNDAAGLVCAPYLEEIGINLFNFSYNHGLLQMRDLVGDVVLLGNLPTVEVLANGIPEDVDRAVSNALSGMEDMSRIVFSCGGGMPPNGPSENIRAVLSAVRANYPVTT